ncbi:hypothetical protein [Kitasatospora sp. NPDC048407]|uniref:hypothetical protein n=1 Tax=Kitasatospora sp. NPDC048407 TaxID=3364051 RepID=UPI00371B8499
MRRLLTSLALAGATALLPTLGMVAAAPAAHATVSQCVDQATRQGAPPQAARAACQAAANGDFDTCTGLLEDFIGPVAQFACLVAGQD